LLKLPTSSAIAALANSSAVVPAVITSLCIVLSHRQEIGTRTGHRIEERRCTVEVSGLRPDGGQ
jgi:hypothetical protein